MIYNCSCLVPNISSKISSENTTTFIRVNLWPSVAKIFCVFEEPCPKKRPHLPSGPRISNRRIWNCSERGICTVARGRRSSYCKTARSAPGIAKSTDWKTKWRSAKLDAKPLSQAHFLISGKRIVCEAQRGAARSFFRCATSSACSARTMISVRKEKGSR